MKHSSSRTVRPNPGSPVAQDVETSVGVADLVEDTVAETDNSTSPTFVSSLACRMRVHMLTSVSSLSMLAGKT